MKLRPHTMDPNLTQIQISKHEAVHESELSRLDRPNPPSSEAVRKAQFVDKTYTWAPKKST